jgi:hypothetical protein
MQKDSEWMQRTLGYQHANGPPWARVVKDAFEGMQAFDHERGMERAEANAVEAAPTTAQVIGVLNTLGDSEMDRLIAEVDDTLATAVVRRWPRLMAAGMLNRTPEEVPHDVAHALDRMEQVMGSPDGMGPQAVAEPSLIPMEIGQIDRFVIHEGTVLNPAAAWPVPTTPPHGRVQRVEPDTWVPTGRDPNTWPHAPVPDESWIEPAMRAVEASLQPAPNFVIVPPASPETVDLLSHLQPASSPLVDVTLTDGTLAQADDDLLAQLRHAGLAPIVIDESTSFSDLPNLNTERQE